MILNVHARTQRHYFARKPPQHDRSIEIVDRFHQSMTRKGCHSGLSVDALEGFIAASLLGEIFSHIDGNIAKERIVEATLPPLND